MCLSGETRCNCRLALSAVMPFTRELMQEKHRTAASLHYRARQLGNGKQPPTCTSWHPETTGDSLKKIPQGPRLRQLRGQRDASRRSAENENTAFRRKMNKNTVQVLGKENKQTSQPTTTATHKCANKRSFSQPYPERRTSDPSQTHAHIYSLQAHELACFT